MSHARDDLISQNLSDSANWRRDIQLYARLVIYELIALVPAILLVVPYERHVSSVGALTLNVGLQHPESGKSG